MDVLGMGAVAVDDLLSLDGFPRPDSKTRVVRRERQGGGLTGTALVAARRMGAACAYAGILGADELSRFILDGLAAEGVSVDLVQRREGAGPYHSTILVDTREKTRTIMAWAGSVVPLEPADLPRKAILSARVVFVDHVGLDAMVEATLLARGAGIPVVGDLERRRGPKFEELLAAVDHPIVPWDLAAELTGATDGPSAARGMGKLPAHPRAGERSAVVVTRGVQGSWCASAARPGAVFHQPAFGVQTVDTTGCGDVFHGAYAAALCEGMGLEERLRFAAAVAALKATREGGQKGIPSREEVGRFLAARGDEAKGAWA